MSQKISQKDNFEANFGTVWRSSAIFYFKKSDKLKTTISVFNYWKVKRDINPLVVLTLRDLQGKLVDRFSYDFKESLVENFTGDKYENFEGSLEVETFANCDLVIPYSAIMAFYTTPGSVSMVHSYGRTYSHHEIEEGRTITQGEEACWTLRDSDQIRSFGVFHNGLYPYPAQTMKLVVTNSQGKQLRKDIPLAELKPFETIKIIPQEHLPELPKFLEGETGNATLSFNLEGSFTRMLIGHESKNGDDIQVTHSNFNYGVHQTDSIPNAPFGAYMQIPALPEINKELVIYPDCDKGDYETTYNGTTLEFQHGKSVKHKLATNEVSEITFKKKDGALPTRIVTGLRLSKNNGVLPAECSLGVEHHLVPPKRFHWGPVRENDDYQTKLVISQSQFEGYKDNQTEPCSIRLYSTKGMSGILEREITTDQLSMLEKGASMTELFPEAKEFLAGEYGWFTLYTKNPRWVVYMLMENKKTQSVTIEHSF